MNREFYHTQEFRYSVLDIPVASSRDDAWLGNAYYFWLDYEDAEYWGYNSKQKTGTFSIYKGEIILDDVLDTVFNEDHYNWWIRQIEKTAKRFIEVYKEKPTLKELNDWLKDENIFEEIPGILFQDLPANADKLLVKPIIYTRKNVTFQYKKRIQLAVYDLRILITFVLLKHEKCIKPRH